MPKIISGLFCVPSAFVQTSNVILFLLFATGHELRRNRAVWRHAEGNPGLISVPNALWFVLLQFGLDEHVVLLNAVHNGITRLPVHLPGPKMPPFLKVGEPPI